MAACSRSAGRSPSTPGAPRAICIDGGRCWPVSHDEGGAGPSGRKVLLLPDGVEDQWSDGMSDLVTLA
jgi:hypothetical protein